MGGNDKGLLKINGETLVHKISSQLRQQCDSILINANRNLKGYAELGFPVIEDSLADFQGPLAGMLSGLEHITTEWMITTPCDGPILADDYVKRMFQSIQDHPIAIASADGRFQPVYVLLHKSVESSLKQYLQSGERKIDRWIFQHPYCEVDFSDQADMFKNINNPEELEHLKL